MGFRPRRSISIGVALSLLSAGLVVTADPASAYSAAVELNAAGGTVAGTDGLRIRYGSGQLQVTKDGVDQLAGSIVPDSTTVATLLNGYYLRIGTTLVGAQHAGISGGTGTVQPWTAV